MAFSAAAREAARRLEDGTLLPSGAQHENGTSSGHFEFTTGLGEHVTLS
jgi:hypothetical protein